MAFRVISLQKTTTLFSSHPTKLRQTCKHIVPPYALSSKTRQILLKTESPVDAPVIRVNLS